MLTVKNLTVKIGDKKILDGISFDFQKGKVYAVMGPNGSGKSTLAATIMGHPAYKINEKSHLRPANATAMAGRQGYGGQAKIKFQNKDIIDLSPDKRAKLGIFMSFQTPLSLSGVNIYQLMMYALSGKKDPLTIRQAAQKYAKMLKISDELLTRSLNEGFSGGEKKKMEILQAALLDPQLLIFDEIDTGVDVDALRSIANFINKMKSSGKTFIIITHYNRILKYLKPDKVLVIIDGKLVKTGNAKLAEEIEKEGYDKINSNVKTQSSKLHRKT